MIMSKKILVIVGMAIVIAASGGVIALNSGSGSTGGTSDASSAAVTEAEPDNGDPGEVSDISVDDLDESIDETPVETNAAPTSFGTVEPSVSFDQQIAERTMFIKFVVDHSTGAEASPRIVFGESYDSCYIVFSPNKTFELCVDPSSGMTRSGSYEIVGDLISVTYDNGNGAEYDILVDEEGNLTHVIVSYGDYDIYFG